MSDGETSKNTGVSVKIGLAKETDKAVAGILTALLKPGATELGNLFGDGLGMLADIVKAKRERNAQLGLEQVRDKLESAAIDLKDVTPPKEEELYLLINGLSLSDDVNVRDLWSGLFAKAVDPNSQISAERAYISVLQSLSPTDAKIIDLIALTMRLDADLNPQRSHLMSRRLKHDQHQSFEERLLKDCEAAIAKVQERAAKYDLAELKGSGWSGNLARLGVIEQVHVSGTLDLNFSATSLGDVMKRVEKLSELARSNMTDPKQIFSAYGGTPQLFLQMGSQALLAIKFTNFGHRFAMACGLLQRRSSSIRA